MHKSELFLERHGCWNQRDKLQILDLDGVYMVEGYPICVKLPIQIYVFNNKYKTESIILDAW